MDATCVILAGGESRRMGRDKLGEEIGGVPMLHRVLSSLREVCGEVLVAGDAGPCPPGVRRVSDLRPGRQGPLAGMEAGLSEASFPAVLVVAGDMPFTSAALAAHLIDLVSAGGTRAAVPRHAGRVQPLFAAYDRGVLPVVSAELDAGRRSAAGILVRLGRVDYVEDLERFGDPGLLLMSVNTPLDLETARRMV
ncbi:Molybdenum cofactor guanylyltransferase [Rubrobacter xylanophilus DSM 9941]|uniref:molybdenum cofactor guanylyltransferase n=1 Tax=Rubrobacter xylanophilus TaxID=49319 RepID=UPI001C644031|nr:molybdenum cofactor guanylyltransferase [Rubrobacter xylanophilus]QYJ14498.1 Molybdenum cofactor guanylyltransferase [Rubrobacter xylanophilus DSM 9941]